MRRQRVADAGRHAGRAGAARRATAHGLEQVLGQGLGAVGVAHAGQHQELVAAEAADRVAGSHGGLQCPRQFHQQRVARSMAMRVVQRLEAVEVDEVQSHRLRGAGRRGGVQPLHHRAATQRVGERVALGAQRQPLLCLGQLVHVDGDRVDALHLAVVVEVGHVARSHPARALRQVGHQTRVLHRLAGQCAVEVGLVLVPSGRAAHVADGAAQQFGRTQPHRLLVGEVDEAQPVVAVDVGQRVGNVLGEAVQALAGVEQALALEHVVVDVPADGVDRFHLTLRIAVGKHLHPHPSRRGALVGDAPFVVDRAAGKGRSEGVARGGPGAGAVQLGQRAADQVGTAAAGPARIGHVAEQQPGLVARHDPTADGQVDGVDEPLGRVGRERAGGGVVELHRCRALQASCHPRRALSFTLKRETHADVQPFTPDAAPPAAPERWFSRGCGCNGALRPYSAPFRHGARARTRRRRSPPACRCAP